MSFWYPILQDCHLVRTPKTEIIKTGVNLGHLLDGEIPYNFAGFLDDIHAAARRISEDGPWFLRTGMLSGKHDWPETCYVPTIDAFASHIGNLVEASALCDMMGRPFNVWAVREYIPMVTAFTAFHGLPVNKERRYFIEGGTEDHEVICHHHYWPQEAIEDTSNEFCRSYAPKDDPLWKEKLAELNTEDEGEITYLSGLSRAVSYRFEGAWSLDWSLAQTGEWVAIDMAVAEESYHWPDCPNASLFKRSH